MGLSRRSFISLGGGAFAASALGELKIFETGIENETVLKVERREIDIGLGKAFKVLHASDTHLNFFDAVDFCAGTIEKRQHFHRRWVRFPQAVQSFYATLDYARKENLPLLHTGDLMDFTTDGNERFLVHNMGKDLMHYAIGNHEYQTRAPEHYDPHPEEVRRRVQKLFSDDLTVSSRIIGGVNFVAFDNARANLRDETIAGVRREFERHYPIVLMCHIPPFYTAQFQKNAGKTGNVWDSYDWKTRDFYTWVQSKPSLKAILCGHTHIAEIDGFSETAQMYVAGANYEGRVYELVFK